MARYELDANLYARPNGLDATEPISLRGLTIQRLTRRGAPIHFDQFLPVSFEQAVSAMQRLPQLDVEPDGYFVFSGHAESQRWQIDGHLYDFSDRLHRVQLAGCCPREHFDLLLACFGASQAELVFELTREGVVLDEVEFRRWAAE